MIRVSLITLLILSCIYNSFSQNNLTGQVTSGKGEAIFAANIYIKNEVTLGVTSDFDGNFEMVIPQQWNQDTLVISYVGYLKAYYPIEQINWDAPLEVKLKSDDQTIVEILVKAKKPVSEEFAVTKLDRLKIYTTPIAQGDPLKAITALAASTNTDESANPSLRGSAPNRSLVVFNRVPIYSPVRNSQINGTGFFSLLNPEMIDQQFVYASNPPLTYGNASAGLVEIETNKTLAYDQIQWSTALANVGVFGAKSLGKKSFIQAYGNTQFSSLFIELNEPTILNLRSFGNTDAGINFHSQLSEKTHLNIFTYGINESYEAFVGVLNYEGPAEGSRLRNFNILNLETRLKKSTLSLNIGFDQNRSTYEFGALDINSRTKDWYWSFHDKLIVSKQYTVEFGSALTSRSFHSTNELPLDFLAIRPEVLTGQFTIGEQLTNWELFSYQKLSLSEKTLLTAGIRGNLLAGKQPSYLSVQLGWRQYLNDNHSFLLSGGQYHNFTTPNYFITQFQLLKSKQLAFDYTYTQSNLQIKAATFYKQEFGDQSQDQFITSREDFFGLELEIEKELSRRWSFTLANTFLNHQIKVGETNYDGSRDFDYFTKATINYRSQQGISAALIYVARPGIRYTPIVGSGINDQGNFFPLFSNQVNGSRFEDYNNLSFSISRYKATKTGSFTLFLNVNNILNIENQQGFYYNEFYDEELENFYQLRTIYFGAVWQLKSN